MITIHLPKGTFFDLTTEIGVAKNIRDTKNRKNTIRGMKIIQEYLKHNRNHNGISLYWNDEKLVVENYDRNVKRYYCGKELLKIKKQKEIKFVVVIIDLTECYCAKIYDDGEIEKVFEINSDVGNKHQQGGQSAQRFSRIREQQITTYFKRINEKLKRLKEKIVIGINFIYKNRLNKSLSTEVKNNILRWDTTEYGGISGVNQFRNINLKD